MATIRIIAPAMLAFTLRAAAQCPFDPTITPDDLILCPNEQGELTTQVYDAYQWYKDGVAIPNANAQTLPVDQFNDAGYTFTVEATLNGCTEMSPGVLVDGWAFLPPYVIQSGDEPLYFNENGVAHHCLGDTVLLVFSFTNNVTWTNNGVAIPGEITSVLEVTATGNYSASGAPSICPDMIMPLGLEVSLVFLEPTQPVIEQNDDQLCAVPAGIAHQWFLNGEALAGTAACITPTAPGAYTVEATYAVDCSMASEPFLITSLDELAGHRAPRVFPSPSSTEVTVELPAGMPSGKWMLMDGTGREVLRGTFPLQAPLRLDVSALAPGNYWLRLPGQPLVPLSVVR
jgi:hypothetical protein